MKLSSTLKIYILAINSFLVGTTQYIISGILDNVSKTFGITISTAGQFITIFSLVYGIFTPIFLALTARMDRRNLILYSLGLFVLSNILAFFSPGYGWFFVARIIMALGAGIVVVTSLTIAAKIAQKGKQGSAIATVMTGLTTSLVIGVPLGRVISDVFGWKYIFCGIALLGILEIIVMFFTIPKEDGDKPVPLLQQLALLKRRKVALGLAITFFWLGGYSVAYTYISPYLLNISGVHENLLSGALLIFGIASLIGSKFGGYSTDRWGVTFTLVGGMALHILMLILLSLVTNTFIGVMVILVLWSFSAWTSGPTQQFHLAAIEPDSSSVLLGLNQSMMQLAIAAGAGVGGIAVKQGSLASVTWVGAIGVMIAIIVTIMTSRSNSKKKLSNTA